MGGLRGMGIGDEMRRGKEIGLREGLWGGTSGNEGHLRDGMKT